jgi:hypothetical protein
MLMVKKAWVLFYYQSLPTTRLPRALHAMVTRMISMDRLLNSSSTMKKLVLIIYMFSCLHFLNIVLRAPIMM